MEKILIGILGVFLGALLAVVRELYSDYRSKKNKAEYIAVRVSFMLDHFISGCVDVVGDDGDMYGRDEQGCLQLQTKKPEIDFISLNFEWQSLPFSIMYEILNFPSLVDEANGKISSVFEYETFPPDYEEGIEERQFQYSKLGLLANDLSVKLRSKYGMPKKVYENWDPVGYLKENKQKIDELRKVREEKHRAPPAIT